MTEQGENAGTFGWGLPEQKGSYDPALEKDACGVGFMVQVKGIPSHSIVQFGNTVLCKSSSRGAVGADPRDGDGAGLMCAVPHKFLERVLREQGTMSPEKGSYACGNIFLSPDESVRSHSFAEFEKISSELELKNLAWRQVPVDSSVLGPMSKSKEPLIYQPFIVPNKPMDAATFKKTSYVLRKRAMHAIGLPKSFYICSLNTQTIVYKGQLTPAQVYSYFPDIGHDDFESHFALVHSRFSTNTFPSWDRAQPMRWLAHNGEINTLGGNINWMKAREGILESHVFDDLSSLFPIIEPFGSDSATFDNVLELIIENGVLSLPEAIMMMVPEAWQNNPYMDEKKKAWYQWASCIMEPWDGPALFTFADGRYCGACLDRNGLRPCRYWLTDDDIMICASEVGTLDIDPPKIQKKGRLMPGRILLVDTQEGRVVEDEEIKSNAASRHNFSKTISEKLFTIDQVVERVQSSGSSVFTHETSRQIDRRMHVYGFSVEQLNLLIIPMLSGMEGLGSMGHDGALACVSTEPRVIYEYFRQLFAQVTNPPIDPLREELIMSSQCYVGPGGNLLESQPDLQCAKLSLPSPMLSSIQMHAVHNVHLYDPQWRSCSIDITFPREEGEEGYVKALDRICREGQNSVEEGHRIIVSSDRNTSFQRVPLSTLVACGAVHHHLVDLKQRLKVVLVVETAEAREVHHMCVLSGYGADAICPYSVHDLIEKSHRDNAVPALNMSAEQMIYNYSDACDHGISKVMSKMGISTLQSYKGAQIFEASGLDDTVVKRCFKGTATRIRGSTFYTLARDALAFHEYGFPTSEDQSIEPTNTPDKTAYNLREAGEYHYRIGGESHMNTPGGVVNSQDAVRTKNIESYRAYSREMQEQTNKCALRGMLDIAYEKRDPIPVEEVEDWTSIVKRFVTGAMSYGSISEEAHSALAIAMNRIGTKSNTGEGGEDSETSVRGGDSRRSSTKQVASGRFGVTGYYSTNAEESQIKLAQGAKPGEGGELPGHKVSESIAKTRKSTAGVGLISPPPHHDIYSIEDLKQLIYDLKCSNPRARISVKLVSEVGIGVISAGVAKAKAEHILISGHDGGTGAARWTGIKHAGLPWELGLAETHQTLVLNNLRNKVVLQTDGQIRTGLDVAVACLLGAEEWGFATTPLIASGCIMMRKCHSNTCPVGVATQDPELRKKFVGQPEHVINFFYYVAEELRDIMAKSGFRKITDMVGRSDSSKFRGDEKNPKMSNIDFTKMLHLTPFQFSAKIPQNFNLDLRIENQWMDEMMKAVDGNDHVRIEAKVSNTDRTLGATISSKIHAKFREEGMTKGSIHIKCNGSAGQSFGAFLAKGVTLELEGDANDYVGKGLSGGRVIIFPPKTSKFIAEENVIVGNVCFYGATSGRAYVRGIAAERFAVRNSGAEALVEGVGDHGCEYMTGGRVIILGKCGRNFGAGMSGGIAYVWDPEGTFPRQVNRDLVQLETMEDPEEIDYVKKFLEEHHQLTGSEVAGRSLAEWTKTLGQFVVVMPRDYKAVMEKQKKQKQVPQAGEIKELSNGHPKAHSNGHSNGNSNGIPPKNQIQKDTAEKIADLEDIVTDEEVAKKQLDKIRGFMKYKHKHDKYRRAKERSEDWKEISYRIDERESKTQTAR